jgi:hypothetical protein
MPAPVPAPAPAPAPPAPRVEPSRVSPPHSMGFASMGGSKRMGSMGMVSHIGRAR